MISLSHGLMLSSILFFLGFVGITINCNLLFILIYLEIMVHSSALIFIMSGNYWKNSGGQLMYIFILTMSAADICISLALLLRLYRFYQTLDINEISEKQK